MTLSSPSQATLICGLLAGAIFGLSVKAHGQVSTSFSQTQTTTTQATAVTENFTNATVGGLPAIGAGTYTTTGDARNGNLNFTTLGTNSFTTSNANASSPLGSTTDKFLAIGNSTGQTASVTMTFTNSTIHYFGLLWGSADAANTVTLNLSNNGTTSQVVFTAASIGLATTTNDYVNFTTNSSATTITSAVLSYNSTAFEVDNISYGVVPEAGTGVSVVVLVGGAVWLARRQASRRLSA